MSVSLLEVIQAAGYNLDTKEDAQWFLSKESEFDDLVEHAENIIEEIENKELEEAQEELETEE